MNTDLISHLVNLKILSDFNQSKLDSADLFWSLIKEGKDPTNLRKKVKKFNFRKHYYKQIGYSPTVEEIEKASQKKEHNRHRDFRVEYQDYISSQIEQDLQFEGIIPPEIFDLDEIYNGYIRNSKFLIDYLKIDRPTFRKYVSLMKGKDPKSFTPILRKFENPDQLSQDSEDKGLPEEGTNKDQSNEIPFPRIFSSLEGYQIFAEYKENHTIRHADLSYLYRKLKKEKYIDENARESEFRVWYSDQPEGRFFKSKLKLIHTVNKDERRAIVRNIIIKIRDNKKHK